MSNPGGLASSASKPGRPTFRVKGANDMVRDIGNAIFLLDHTIYQWSEQLNRAQPHRNGRLVVRFGKNTRVRVGGDVAYDVEPIVGRMVLMQSGSWRFFKLTDRDQYTKLSDLRIGQKLKSDPLVVRLIDGIEEMLKQRQALCDALTALKGMSGLVSSTVAACARRGEQVVDLADRVKIDWSQGPEKAERLLTEQRRERYARYKEAKLAHAKGVAV